MINARISNGLIVIATCFFMLNTPSLAQVWRGNESPKENGAVNIRLTLESSSSQQHQQGNSGAVEVTLTPELLAQSNQYPTAARPIHLQPANDGTGQQGGRRLGAHDVSRINFSDAEKFLNTKSFKFADPNKFLKNSQRTSQRRSPTNAKRSNSRFASTRKRILGKQDRNDSNSSTIKRPESSRGLVQQQTTPYSDDDRYLTVSDVYQPIGFSPFADMGRTDPHRLLSMEQFPVPAIVIRADSYSELTGQYFQPHFASWSAHHFKHRPLLFEEVNLERYGNALRHQHIVSAAHFFASAALLPYKLGQAHDNPCITTLGHYRPGECVSFQIHRRPLSKKGLLLQGLMVTALVF